jgi:hypothetical protein
VRSSVARLSKQAEAAVDRCRRSPAKNSDRQALTAHKIQHVRSDFGFLLTIGAGWRTRLPNDQRRAELDDLASTLNLAIEAVE